MTFVRHDPPRSLLAAVRRMRLSWKLARDQKRALEAIAAKSHSHLLEDAGLTRDDAAHIVERQRLHRIAEWDRWRRRGI